jgi:transglutaminase-like putative cysteine protease
MRIHLHHVTHYQYDRAVTLGPQLVRLHPTPHCRARIASYALTVEPPWHFINWQQDPLANHLARLVFTQPTAEFKLSVDMDVELVASNPFDFFLDPLAGTFPFSYSARDTQALAPYLACDAAAAEASSLRAYLQKLSASPRPTLDFLVALNQQVQSDIHYRVRLEPGVQTPLETLQSASGSCRDSAWLLVQLLRLSGLAARFVSGYLLDIDPSASASHPPLDTSQLHAWCEVYLPGAGWIGLDATSGLLTGMGHIPLACALQPADAAPVEGATDVAQVQFNHRIELTLSH